MKRKILTLLGGSVLTVALVAGPAAAAPGDNGNGVGGCTSGVLYGNTTNERPSGHGVLPSLAPGPRSVGGGFLSMGDVQQGAHDLVGAPAGNYSGRDVLEVVCTFP
jgi:hypothetical protein